MGSQTRKTIVLTLGAALVVMATAWAQSVPQTVVRIGDWVEIGDEAFMNIIGNIDARFNTTHNADFEDDIRDRTASRNPVSSGLNLGPGDYFEAEIRFGADFRYKKNLTTRILFETQSIFDGNLIDDRGNASSPSRSDAIGGASGESNSPHVERFWIDYKWSDLIRTRVGADLWRVDQFGLLGEDDPRAALYLTPSKDLEILVSAVLQNTSSRLGLTNNNDNLYFPVAVTYTGIKGHSLQLAGAYFHYRFQFTQDASTFMIVPNYEGKFGPIQVRALAAAVFGAVDGAGGEDYDVFGWGAMANIVADLGSLKPWVGFVYGSPDDDAADGDLNGFHHSPSNEISLGSGRFEWGNSSPSMADWGPSAGANAALGGGVLGSSTTGNMFLDRLGNGAHPGTTVAYSNAGTLRLAGGLHFDGFSGHRLTGYYQYVGFVDDATLGGNIDKTLYHELTGVWEWRINKHFDIQAIANFFLPGDGTKDMAATVMTCGDGTQACQGDDIAFRGNVQVRTRF